MTAYYTATGNPPASTRGLSAQLRAEFNLIVTAFNAVQADILLRSIKGGDTYTGTHDYTGATLKAPTKAAGTNTTDVATTAFVVAASLNASLPGQTSNAGKVIVTDGTTASWGSSLKATVIRFSDGSDPTKLLAFDVSGFTTGTTRTLTVPDKSGTLVMTSDSATQTQMEAQSSTTVFASPGSLKWHPGVAKAWIKCGVAADIQASQNVTSISDDGAGLVTVTMTTAFSSANYAIVCSTMNTGVGTRTLPMVKAQAASTFQITSLDTVTGAATDPTNYYAACFGDQP